MTANQLLSFEIEGYHFGLTVELVDRVVPAVEIAPLPDAPEAIIGLINVHGAIMPVLNVRKKLGLPERPVCVTDYFVIATTKELALALPVDSVEGLVEYSDDQLVTTDRIFSSSSSSSSSNLATSESSLSLENSPTKVMRILDGLLVVCEPDHLLNQSERSMLAVALSRQGGEHDQRV